MKCDDKFRPITLLLLTAAACLSLTGCNSSGTPDPATTALREERDRLVTDNQDVAQLRAQSTEVQRLKTENQELPKIRSQYQEAGRLKKENEQLRQQIAKISPTNALGHAEAASASPPSPGAGVVTGAAPEGDHAKDIAQEEGTLNEGDDVMVDPKYLKQLLPDFDWEKLGRKDPLGVRNLLQLTNTAQLRQMGVTNYTVRRAPPAPAPAPAQEEK